MMELHSISEESNVQGMSPMLILAIVLGTITTVIIILSSIVWFLRRKHKSKRDDLSKRSIYPYLTHFYINDMDLRKAPTGGWHGTYLNKLAIGVNDYDTDTSTNSTSSKSS